MSVVQTVTQPLRTLYRRSLFHVGRRIRCRHVLAALNRQFEGAGRLLDAGCGAGDFALAIARRHPELEVEGLELHAGKVALAEHYVHRLGLKNLRFRVGDITLIDCSRPYDVVLSVDVLEHIPDDGAALAAIAQALRPGGHLILHTPRSSPRRFFAALNDHHQDDHVRDGYEAEDLRVRVRAAGFSDVEIHRTFGAAGELAWEIMQLVRNGNPSRAREVLGAALSPLLLVLCELDFWLGGGAQGNGLMVLARRQR